MRRVLVTAAGLAVCLGAAACTSSGSDGTSPTPTPGASHHATSGTPVAPSTLAALVQRGLAGVDSVHLMLTTRVTGSPAITGAGDVALRHGTLSAADLTEGLPGGLGTVRIVVAGGRTYAKLPAGLGSSGKPWLVLSTSSSRPLVAQLAGTVSSVLSVASPSTAVSLIRAASGARDLGATTVSGAPAHRYLVTVPASKLSSLPGGLSAGSARSVPVEIAVAPSGRPVRLSGSLELDGAQVTPTVTLTRYGETTSIQAPPASQVSG